MRAARVSSRGEATGRRAHGLRRQTRLFRRLHRRDHAGCARHRAMQPGRGTRWQALAAASGGGERGQAPPRSVAGAAQVLSPLFCCSHAALPFGRRFTEVGSRSCVTGVAPHLPRLCTSTEPKSTSSTSDRARVGLSSHDGGLPIRMRRGRPAACGRAARARTAGAAGGAARDGALCGRQGNHLLAAAPAFYAWPLSGSAAGSGIMQPATTSDNSHRHERTELVGATAERLSAGRLSALSLSLGPARLPLAPRPAVRLGLLLCGGGARDMGGCLQPRPRDAHRHLPLHECTLLPARAGDCAPRWAAQRRRRRRRRHGHRLCAAERPADEHSAAAM